MTIAASKPVLDRLRFSVRDGRRFVYEEILRSYADRPEAASARARLDRGAEHFAKRR
jgi:hypothetical protein